MQLVQVRLKTTITQGPETESFEFSERGQLEELDGKFILNYRESGTIPVRIETMGNKVELKRGVAPANYSKLHFAVGQRVSAEYVVDGQTMEIATQTKSIKRSQPDVQSEKIVIEYDLYTGVNLVGNYFFELIFTK